MYFLRGRPYAPAEGRFPSEDPTGYGPDANLYRYVGNNPVNRVDPSGLFAYLLDYNPSTRTSQSRDFVLEALQRTIAAMRKQGIDVKDIRPDQVWYYAEGRFDPPEVLIRLNIAEIPQDTLTKIIAFLYKTGRAEDTAFARFLEAARRPGRAFDRFIKPADNNSIWILERGASGVTHIPVIGPVAEPVEAVSEMLVEFSEGCLCGVAEVGLIFKDVGAILLAGFGRLIGVRADVVANKLGGWLSSNLFGGYYRGMLAARDCEHGTVAIKG
jgi:hypothetical protein